MINKTEEEIQIEGIDISKFSKEQIDFCFNHPEILDILKIVKEEARKEFLKMIDKCSNIKCGWSEDICDRIDKEELEKQLQEQK